MLLEYDSPRAGNFAPLRFVPDDKIVVLGLITTKEPELETPTQLKRARSRRRRDTCRSSGWR